MKEIQTEVLKGTDTGREGRTEGGTVGERETRQRD